MILQFNFSSRLILPHVFAFEKKYVMEITALNCLNENGIPILTLNNRHLFTCMLLKGIFILTRQTKKVRNHLF